MITFLKRILGPGFQWRIYVFVKIEKEICSFVAHKKITEDIPGYSLMTMT